MTGPNDSLFSGLIPQAPDGLLALIGAYRSDPRPGKLDLGVGVYRDAHGRTPVFAAVKAAEQQLLERQDTKAYLGAEGDVEYLEMLKPLVFGARSHAGVFGVQTPGGTGALRLAAELLAVGRPEARLFVGAPTWPNHEQIFEAVGVPLMTYRYFDAASQTVCFETMMDALATAAPGDAVLLQGACHNPTGADLDSDQWRTLADLVAKRGLFPIIDLAYQGLGRGLEDDARGMRCILEATPEALVAYSCDKNFGLYRERTGALFAVSDHPRRLSNAGSNILALTRANWSMPPDHGAAVVRIILSDDGLTTLWASELKQMRQRLIDVRTALAAHGPHLAALKQQNGLFACLPLTPHQIARFRDDHAVYLASSGRINLAGLTVEAVPDFIRAFHTVSQPLFS